MNNFHEVHNLAYHSGVMPTYEPLKLLSDSEYQKHVDYSHEFAYSKLLASDSVRLEILGPIDAKTARNLNLNSDSSSSSLTTVESIHKAYTSGRLTPNDFIHQAISNAEKLSHLNLFIQFNTTDILLQAEESTQRWKSGKQLSVLDGIPVAVKDEFDVIGYNTTYGTKFMAEFTGSTKSKDCTIVDRFRKLGAIIFGKTNMHEIGIGTNGYNANWGTTKNPYSKKCEHDTGGSSSGSGAVVAAGLVPIAVGADGGGSIRVPSALNGVVGLKATYARIPFLPQSCCWSVVHSGILTSSLRDQMIGYMAIAGIDSDVSVVNPPKHFHLFQKKEDLSELTIGIYWDWFSHGQKEVKCFFEFCVCKGSVYV